MKMLRSAEPLVSADLHFQMRKTRREPHDTDSRLSGKNTGDETPEA